MELRPAARSVRQHRKERGQLIVKAALASVLAWLAATYLVGHSQPYFAPLAALLGVYPTVARSLRESVAYAAGFVVAALLAVPVALLIGPGPVGIAVVIVLALLVGELPWFGEQSAQIPFTALFTLLMGGHDVLPYVEPRLVDVAVGLVTGLAVNSLLFPPLHLRGADYAVQELRHDLAAVLEDMATATDDFESWDNRWQQQENRLLRSVRYARSACDQGSDSLRGNPRTKRRWEPWGTPQMMSVLERGVAYTRSIADALRKVDGASVDPSFLREYAHQLCLLAETVRDLPRAQEQELEPMVKAQHTQRSLEEPHYRETSTHPPGLWDPQKELLRLSQLMLDDLNTPLH
ncbi:FUSC family protein [Actinomadura hibisca]|uniref:FUSC family protein n=1 Tax=Actinomadura hibisca TaxID=68565 RepID=UPI00082DCA36|nr:FUSC family protein [Actinomadura hibisca]